MLVDTIADVERAKKEGKLAIVLHFQGTNPVEGDIKLIEVYHRLGIRHMLMAYNMKNLVGDGCMERTDDGLSRFGVALVQEMNRVGMIVDVTHTGYRTSMDTFEVSEAPVIMSHSNPAAVWDIPRNVKDDQMKACAKSGGVMCINGVGGFMGEGLYTFPNEFKIQFLMNQKGALVQNKFLPKIHNCVCTNVSTNYTPEGFWVAMRDGRPVSYNLSLSFTETQKITQSAQTSESGAKGVGGVEEGY